MFTWGAKYLFGLSVASFLGAIVYGLFSGGGIVGVLSGGYKGGVGDHVGYMILVALGFATLFLGVLMVVLRDAESEEASAAVGVERALAVRASRSPSYWGPVAAFGIACMAVGLAVSQMFFILGLVILAVVALEWLVLAWSDRATGDAEINSAIRDRMVGPFEIPVLALLGIGVFVIGFSRVLLTVSEAGSVIAAALVAALIFAAAIAIAKSAASRSVITGVVALGALAVLAGGIAGAVNGEREIAHHGDEGHSDEGEEHSEDGAEMEGEDGAGTEGEDGAETEGEDGAGTEGDEGSETEGEGEGE